MYQIAAETAEPASDQPTSTILAQLLANLNGESVTVGEIMDAAGSRAYALALLLFALPEALPLPVAGMSAIIGLPLMLISAQVAILGTESRLPEWVRRRSVSASVFRMVVTKAVPVFRQIERFSRPRWVGLAGASRALGLMCLILALVIALPIPLGNLPPAVCVVALAFGMLQRDGFIVAGALAASAAVVTGMAAAIVLAADFMVETIGNLGAV
ncbi:hypothetical protein GGE65_005277 [Skermanella aerolata]|uniref:exopolysaccharide biosynthesis protein n=1 Tax=Skermanella aerolata TaxID=393310 RepID=UPI003D1D6511